MTALPLHELPVLEEALWVTKTRGDLSWVDSVLAPDFTEHGQSGRVYDREGILELEISDIDCALPLPDLEVRVIGVDTALVTYTSVVSGQRANRSSIWRHVEGRWILQFHQGTPVR